MKFLSAFLFALCLFCAGVEADDDVLDKYELRGKALCNDGSRPVFYFGKGTSDSWVIFLQAHEICYSNSSCMERAQKSPQMVSTANDPPTMRAMGFVGGILSSNKTENPHFHDANRVFVRYCSSDNWVGTSLANQIPNNTTFNFMGAVIIEEVIEELVGIFGLGEASQVVWTGEAASGASGALLTVDRVAFMLRQAPKARVFGLVDNGWFPWQERLVPGGNCDVLHNCSMPDALHFGLAVWRPLLPLACAHLSDKVQCFFPGTWMGKTLTPTFHVQQTYDWGLLEGFGVKPPANAANLEYIEQTASTMREIMSTVPSYLPSCCNHDTINVGSMFAQNGFIGNLTVADAFQLFVTDSWTFGSLVDDCLTYLCNPNCPPPFYPPS